MASPGPLDKYRRTKTVPDLRSCMIPLSKYNTSMRLSFPDHGLVVAPSDMDGDEDPPSKVLGVHRRFRFSINQGPKDEKKTMQRTFAEVSGIYLVFPEVRSERIRICMAAWLGTLCDIDDLLEEMTPGDAEGTISALLAIMREDNVYDGSKCFSGKTKVLSIAKIFLDHCSKYLSRSELEAFFGEVCTTYDGFLRELNLRQGHIVPNLDTYLDIRTRTIGIAPFFSLIRNEFSPGHNSEVVLDIQRDVNLAVGLQNDLIGLEKDTEKGESMNAVTFVMENSTGGDEGSTEQRLRAVVNSICIMHDHALSRVYHKHQQLARTVGASLDPALIVANAQLLFTETHLKWCISSKRYQANVL